MSGLNLIPTEKIVERLQYENPWWVTKQIPEAYSAMSKRLYFDLFYPFVKENKVKRALVLMGPRRVGKTVMMFHSIQQLLAESVPPKQIFFIGIDNPIYMQLGLEELLLLAKNAVQLTHLEGCYVFFDEIQYLKDWERHLKVLVDSYPETKFIVSGSAAAALKWHSTESGAGRFTDFMLPPLTFQEFIHLKNKNHLIKKGHIQYGKMEIPYCLPLNLDELNTEFLQYLNFGGYPEVVLSEKIQKDIDKVVHDWKEEGIKVEKARWGRSVITKGKIKIELSKDVDASKLTLAQVQEMIEKKTPAKKAPAKKVAAKKTTAKKK